MLLANDTPFVLDRFAIFDKQGAEVLVVLLKGTFDLVAGELPVVAKVQDPVVPGPVYAGEPDQSGILIDGDYLPPRPGTGVTLTAHAVAQESSQCQTTVAVRIGELTQSAVVYGNRHWDTILGLARISPPEPFERIPLTWENAFGGTDQTPAAQKHWEAQPDNYVGKGFFARKTRRPVSGVPLPNIEHPDQQIRSPSNRPPPVGFCPVAPHWQPRVAFAGTYDEKWLEETAPLLPEDFDSRFHQTAPPGLAAASLFSGGEACVVLGMTPERRLEFNLPSVTPHFRLCWAKGALGLRPRLDSVHLDTDQRRLHLVWRAAEEIHGRLETLERIEAILDRKGTR